ncbi:hypothetical protein [Corynebacterium uterequi]|uniref:Uncharacterized protein n=1 Tax=Corynebacterium uterequi TaxID=1072256 RepID=A0A0G3HH30_9CORY|nr:hypothetical protein [Corynebacterium uterequi]AKK10472.1 hypothetical protein CUTER_02285 [Corynebacterium uterequi]
MRQSISGGIAAILAAVGALGMTLAAMPTVMMDMVDITGGARSGLPLAVGFGVCGITLVLFVLVCAVRMFRGWDTRYVMSALQAMCAVVFVSAIVTVV